MNPKLLAVIFANSTAQACCLRARTERRMDAGRVGPNKKKGHHCPVAPVQPPKAIRSGGAQRPHNPISVMFLKDDVASLPRHPLGELNFANTKTEKEENLFLETN